MRTVLEISRIPLGHIRARRSRLATTPADVVVTGLVISDVRIKSMKGRQVFLKLSLEEAETLRDQLSDMLNEVSDPETEHANRVAVARRLLGRPKEDNA